MPIAERRKEKEMTYLVKEVIITRSEGRSAIIVVRNRISSVCTLPPLILIKPSGICVSPPPFLLQDRMKGLTEAWRLAVGDLRPLQPKSGLLLCIFRQGSNLPCGNA